MGRINLDVDGVNTLAGLQEQLGSRDVPATIRGHAVSLAGTVGSRMKRRDLERVSLFLLQASNDRRVPTTCRHSARYWGAYLDQRL
jgi:hypothetical protein